MPGTEETPVLQIGSKDRSVGWYDPPIVSVDDPIRDLLENYSRISTDNVIPRINSMRDKLWDIFPWPCIGQFRFLDLSLARQPSYPIILERLKSGDRILDIGCCLGQDLRRLAYDGVPVESLCGLEIQNDFLSLASDFFNDSDSGFNATFIQADLFDRTHAELQQVTGTFRIVQLGMILHIWDLDTQTRACERVVELLQDRKGVMVVGQSVGDVTGKAVAARGKTIYKHNVGSFAEMWAEVGRRTGTEWVVKAKLDGGLGIDQQKRAWDEPSSRRLSFEVERV
ncbi:hypothetical protein B0H66DRAFT_511234 [Apodospora peruviana]|uniref:Methyltransferase domain-containing protein n=1 Tax=Apodospora peruviana TaxID=516989 RepID=A0AAE0IH35_9PEZI|nr:hypothetical protein B0H66DRAFT_511234 [Apodospora peruviana]